MKQNIFRILVLLSLFAVAGCPYANTKPIEPIKEELFAPEKFVQKTYILQREQMAYVGDTMIRVKDYTIRRKTMSKLSPSGDFSIPHLDFGITGSKNVPLSIVGIVNDENEEYYLINSKYPTFCFPITKSGRYLGGVAARKPGRNEVYFHGKGQLQISPDGVLFSLVGGEEVDATAGYTNFEIVYTGVSSGTINLMYREYTKEDFAKPAFYQSLSYPKNERYIRFKSMRMEILKVNSESINFRVVEE